MMEYVIIFVVLFTAMVIHEYAHAWTAFKLGDPTAKEAGRMTLNPIKHIDLFGTIILPISLGILRFFGSPFFPVALAKPVPVNFMRLRNPRRDMMLVAAAGPAVNIFLVGILAMLMRTGLKGDFLGIVYIAIYVNLLLAVFNMVPIPPLDGSRIVTGCLPRPLAIPYSKLEPYGIFLIFALLPAGLFTKVVLPVVKFCVVWLGVPSL